MTFFKKEHKDLAFRNTREDLQRLYKYSEVKLKACARYGDKDALAEHMKKHQLFEYALLYQKTPEFKNARKKRNGKF